MTILKNLIPYFIAGVLLGLGTDPANGVFGFVAALVGIIIGYEASYRAGRRFQARSTEQWLRAEGQWHVANRVKTRGIK